MSPVVRFYIGANTSKQGLARMGIVLVRACAPEIDRVRYIGCDTERPCMLRGRGPGYTRAKAVQVRSGPRRHGNPIIP